MYFFLVVVDQKETMVNVRVSCWCIVQDRVVSLHHGMPNIQQMQIGMALSALLTSRSRSFLDLSIVCMTYSLFAYSYICKSASFVWPICLPICGFIRCSLFWNFMSPTAAEATFELVASCLVREPVNYLQHCGQQPQRYSGKRFCYKIVHRAQATTKPQNQFLSIDRHQRSYQTN